MQRLTMRRGFAVALLGIFCSAGLAEKASSKSDEYFTAPAPFSSTGQATPTAKFVALVDKGPNALPELVSGYLVETDAFRRRSYAGAISRVGHFWPYTYASSTTESVSSDAVNSELAALPETRDELAGSIDVSKEHTDSGASEAYQKALQQWWDNREKIVQSDKIRVRYANLAHALDGVTSETVNDLEVPGGPVEQFRRLTPYGIFALPSVINAAAKDNNDFAFLEFLRLTNDGLYTELWKGWGRGAYNVRMKFPTAEQKRRKIAEWWQANEGTFTELPFLYTALENAVKQMGN